MRKKMQQEEEEVTRAYLQSRDNFACLRIHATLMMINARFTDSVKVTGTSKPTEQFYPSSAPMQSVECYGDIRGSERSVSKSSGKFQQMKSEIRLNDPFRSPLYFILHYVDP